MITFCTATTSDLSEITALLNDAHLPTAGLEAHILNFMLALDGEKVVGCAGLEVHQDSGLLRSLVVAPGYRAHRIGAKLTEGMIELAQQKKLDLDLAPDRDGPELLSPLWLCASRPRRTACGLRRFRGTPGSVPRHCYRHAAQARVAASLRTCGMRPETRDFFHSEKHLITKSDPRNPPGTRPSTLDGSRHRKLTPSQTI